MEAATRSTLFASVRIAIGFVQQLDQALRSGSVCIVVIVETVFNCIENITMTCYRNNDILEWQLTLTVHPVRLIGGMCTRVTNNAVFLHSVVQKLEGPDVC